MKIYNTLYQGLKEFIPLEEKKVKIYVCGPTVYDYPHLGHARCYIIWDVAVRYLKFKGYDVKYVRNITDIDDKIINKAKETNSSPKQIAQKYYKEFEKTMDELNVAKPDIEPKATENIQEMIEIIKILIEKGFAYVSDGDVYFRVNKYRKYGMLSKQNIDELKAGIRIAMSEKKEDPLDFTLWKETKSDDEISWDSPWGKGRPGWHIECSAMIKKYLGENIDIHAGGQDLIFPHHENEKAESEAAFGTEFVKYWMHNGFVLINEEKMSKSLGNFVTIKDVLDKYDANTIRFFILTSHYRMPIEFSDEGLKSAKAGVKRLKNTIDDIRVTLPENMLQEAHNLLNIMIDEIAKTEHFPFHQIDTMHYLEKIVNEEYANDLIRMIKRFINDMDDDFNTPRALASLFELANCAQRSRELDHIEGSAFCVVLLLKLSGILGFDLSRVEMPDNILVSQLMDIILSVRGIARDQKNWEIADKIRDELKKTGVTLKDHKNGTTSWNFDK
ncbi:MAG: cysteine--tRNA ligase [bacterium]